MSALVQRASSSSPSAAATLLPVLTPPHPTFPTPSHCVPHSSYSLRLLLTRMAVLISELVLELWSWLSTVVLSHSCSSGTHSRLSCFLSKLSYFVLLLKLQISATTPFYL